MKLLVIGALLALSTTAVAQVGIGTTLPASNAVLDIQSTSKAIVLPRLISNSINSIPSPAPGMMAYNTTSGRFVGYCSDGVFNDLITNMTSSQVNYSGNSVGQSFTPSTDILLRSIEAYGNASSPLASGTMTLWQGNPGTGVQIATTPCTVRPNRPVAGVFRDVVLKASVLYTFVCTFPTPPALRVEPTNTYPYGNAYGNGNQVPGEDMIFTVNGSEMGWRALAID